MPDPMIRPSLIPKQKEKNGDWQDILAYFMIALVILSVIVFLLLNFWLVPARYKEVDVLKNKIVNTPVPEKKNKEAELRAYSAKIEAFKGIFSQHKKPSQAFTFLERSIMPQIFIANIKGELEKGTITINGQGNNFETVGKQYLVFKKDPDVESVSLENLAIAGQGVNFQMIVNLKKSVLTYTK